MSEMLPEQPAKRAPKSTNLEQDFQAALEASRSAQGTRPADNGSRVIRPYTHEDMEQAKSVTPGYAMGQRAIQAPVSTEAGRTMQAIGDGAAKVGDLNRSTAGTLVHQGIEAATGVNAQNIVNHASTLTQVTAEAVARQDPLRQAQAKDAQARNEAAMDQMSLDVRASKAIREDGQTAANAQKALDEHQKGSEVSADADLGARIHMLKSKVGLRLAKGIVAKRGGGVGSDVMASTGRAVVANLKLGAANKAIGKDGVDEWQMKDTVGEAVPERLAHEGHVISADDRVQGSMLGNIQRGAKSLNPLGDRPMGNTTKLTDAEKAKIAANKGLIQGLDDKATADKELRKGLTSTKGYTQEEWDRRATLKQGISDLETKQSAELATRSTYLGLGKNTFTDSEQALHTQYGNNITAIEAGAKSRQDATIAAHQGRIDEISAAGTAALAARPKDWRGRAMFTADEQKKYDGHKADLAAIEARRVSARDTQVAAHKQSISDLDAAGKKNASGHKSDEQRQQKRDLEAKIKTLSESPTGGMSLEDQKEHARLTTARDEMKAERNTGLTSAQRKEQADLTAKIGSVKADPSHGLTDEEQAQIQEHRDKQADMEHLRDTGLSKADTKKLADHRAERKEQIAARDTGMTDGERRIKAHLETQNSEIHSGAAAEKEFIARNEGKTVRKLGDQHVIGGLNSTDNVAPEEMEATIGGRAAQRLASTGRGAKVVGEVLKGDDATAQKHLKEGNLAQAAAVAVGGLTGEGLGIAGSSVVPGFGKVSKEGMKALGSFTHGIGTATESVGEHLAEGQNQRDRQRDLTTGDRAKQVRSTHVNLTGAVEQKSPTLMDSVTSGLKTAANAAMQNDDVSDAVTDAKDAVNDNVIEPIKSATVDPINKHVLEPAKQGIADATEKVTHAVGNLVPSSDSPEPEGPSMLDKAKGSAASLVNHVTGDDNGAELVDKGISSATDAITEHVTQTGTELAKQHLVPKVKEAVLGPTAGKMRDEDHAQLSNMRGLSELPGVDGPSAAQAKQAKQDARQASVRGQREKTRAANAAKAGPDAETMQSTFKEAAPAPAPTPAPAPAPAVTKPTVTPMTPPAAAAKPAAAPERKWYQKLWSFVTFNGWR